MKRRDIMRLLAPRYIVNRGALSDHELMMLASSQPGDFITVGNSESIRLLDPRPIRVVMAPQKPSPTAAMGPTIVNYRTVSPWRRAHR